VVVDCPCLVAPGECSKTFARRFLLDAADRHDRPAVRSVQERSPGVSFWTLRIGTIGQPFAAFKNVRPAFPFGLDENQGDREGRPYYIRNCAKKYRRIVGATLAVALALARFIESTHILIEGVERSHVVGAFKGFGVGDGLLAHAAAHLGDRLIFMLHHPFLQVVENVHQATGAVGEQR